MLHSIEAGESRKRPCGRRTEICATYYFVLPEIPRAKGDYVGDTTSNGSEDSARIGRTGKTSNPISHQRKVIPT